MQGQEPTEAFGKTAGGPMILLDGKKISAQRRAVLKQAVFDFSLQHGRSPTLAVILVGDNPASQVYVRNKQLACADVGLNSLKYHLEQDSSQQKVLQQIQELNQNPTVDGILLQLPLPAQLNAEVLIEAIDPSKDVDGFTSTNLGRLLTGSKKAVLPCTPKGIVQLLKDYQIPLQGQNVVVVGRSLIVGKPAGLLFLQENATVTFAHSKTQDLRRHLHQADIAIIAAGSVGFLSAVDFKKGAVLIDVGIHRVQDRWMGDVNPEGLQDVLSAASPVPGGVGPMTITSLLENTLLLAQRRES